MSRINSILLVSIVVLLTMASLTEVCTLARGATGWSKTYGGANAEGMDDIYPVVIQTSDGGFLLTGDTRSYGAGSNDAYFVKTDANGNMQWNKTYGGPLNDYATGLCQTTDGGYAVMATTSSYGAGHDDSYDFWLLKTDTNGNLMWNKTYGGTGNDTAYTVSQTPDGGYVLMGFTSSYGAGGYDAWVVKTNASGNMQWSKTYGGTGNDYGGNLILTADGGYTVVGYSTSFGGYKGWLFKTDSSGNMLWEKTYGIGTYSFASGGIQTTDGGYAVAGANYPTTKRNVWIFKTDSSGNLQWEKSYGGAEDDTGWTLAQMDDGGYAVIGVTASYGSGGADSWLIRTDSSGNMLWDKTYGGAGNEFTDGIIRTSDGGLVIVGFTDSFGAGSTDLWLIKTDAAGVIPEFSSWLIPTLAVVMAGLIIMKKKKLLRAR